MSSAASSALRNFFTVSVGKKQIMALTGLGLSGFILTHLLGNILIVVSPDMFNLYAHKLTSNNLIYVAEAGLTLLFLVHFFLAMNLTFRNKRSRGDTGYYMKVKTGRGTTLASASMPYTGLLILIFLVSHLIHFKYGPVHMTQVEGMEIRDLYRTVIEYFANPLNMAWYLLAMLALCFHLGHGFQSAFQSLGFNHPKYTPCIKNIGMAFAILSSGGFAALCVYCYLQA